MLRIVAREAEGEASDLVRLDHDRRTRRRMVFETEQGRSILLDLARPDCLQDGEVLRLEDGTGVRVRSAPEELIEIAADSTAALVRIAWHLGNRHLPTQLVAGAGGGTLRIRRDHVIGAMVAGLGGRCSPLLAPFDPEGGAYGGDAAAAAHHHHHDDHHHHHDHAHG